MKNSSGFTLTELLVVVTIAVTFAALLLPMFSEATNGSRRAACVNNLRQMGIITNIYAADYDDWFFHRTYHISDPAATRLHTERWPDLLSRLYEEVSTVKGGVLHCPEHEEYDGTNTSFVSYGGLYYGALNYALWAGSPSPAPGVPGQFPQARIPQIMRPDLSVLFGDSDNLNFDGPESVHRGSYVLRNTGGFGRDFGWRHEGMANVLFVNGSVRTLPAANLGDNNPTSGMDEDLNIWLRNMARSFAPASTPVARKPGLPNAQGALDF